MNDRIGSIHVLKRQPDSAHALQLLQRVAAQVRPIMQTRSWRVPVLREFYPRTPNLLGLNVNRGSEIRIRLRSAHNATQFLRYEDLVGTMLHELVHIERAPHDHVFYALLDVLKLETEKLMARGYTGDGFFSGGRRVGVGHSHDSGVPGRTRELAVRAAERRMRFGRQVPRTLGSVAGEQQHANTPSRMAALALDRRLRDEKWCGESMPNSQTPMDSDDDDVVIIVPDMPIVISDSDSEPEPQIHIID
ncbi:hypothetical protein GGF43_000988 [Coemansia sp. RSA 2618]|nr:hypothetical protein GGF43_000988 [Coemansia sp. RSA 2618]